MPYLLDADVFIRAKNLHYGLDFCPAFWDWLDREHAAGQVFSVEKVGDELQAIADNLSTWAQQRSGAFFLRPDAKMLPALAQVSAWIVGQPQYATAARNAFLQAADYYLIAHALAHSDVVVTHEVPAPLAIRKIKIPDVCIGLGVKFIAPHEMLRNEHARFVLR